MSTLVDLTVINLFAQYWSRVTVDSFSTSLIAAILLQVLLQGTLTLEHKVGGWFSSKEGFGWTVGRYFSAWLILFSSKFIMLGAINQILGESVHFSGPFHGAGPFIWLVVAMLAAEEVLTRIYRRLGANTTPHTQ